MKTVKQLMVLKYRSIYQRLNPNASSSPLTKITNRANDINLMFDMDEIAPTLTFTLPYLDKKNKELNPNADEEIFTELQKYFIVELYVGLFDSADEGNTIDDPGFTKVFSGYINSIQLTKTKQQYTYTISCNGSLALAASMGMPAEYTVITGSEYLDTALTLSGMTRILDGATVLNQLETDAGEMPVKWNGGTTVRDTLDEVRTNYGLRVHQIYNGDIIVFSPFLNFAQQNNDPDAISQYNLAGDIFELDYGDVTSNFDTVRVVGANGETITVTDPSTLAAKGVTTSETDANILSTIEVRRYDITSVESLFVIAKNILVENARNQLIKFTVLFDGTKQVGEIVSVSDDDKFSNKTFIVKSINHRISKQGGATTQLTCYRSSIDEVTTTLLDNVGKAQEVGLVSQSTSDVFTKEIDDPNNWSSDISP